MNDLKLKLLTDRVTGTTREVEIPEVGTITVRGLTRFEIISIDHKELSGFEAERILLSHGIVDPVLTPADVEVWQRNSHPDEINQVATVINEMSGIRPNADKEAYKSIPEQP